MQSESKGSHRETYIIIILLTVIATLLAVYVWQHPGPTVAQTASPAGGLVALQNDFTAVAAKVTPAVVSVTTNRKIKVRNPFYDFPWFDFGPDFFGPFFRREQEPRQPREFEQEVPAAGSGFIFRSDGYILTNNHVVRNADEISVKLADGGKKYKAVLKGVDPRTDLAVIKIDAGHPLPTLPLGDSDAVKVGQWVMAIGNPFEYQSTVTVGIVSAKGRSLPADTGPYNITDLIQTDAAINPGNSGGPLVNLKGEAVGICVAIAGPIRGNVGIGFAVPVNSAKVVLNDLIAGKRIVRGWLGVGIKSVSDLDEALKKTVKAEEGVFVAEVRAGSPAEKGGLQPGDVITAFNGVKMTEANELAKAVAATKPGTRATLQVVDRNGRAKTLQIVIGTMPDRYAGFGDESEQPPPAEAQLPASSEALGMTVEPITAELKAKYDLPRSRGVVVTSVEPGGPAAAAGISEGAVILQVGNKRINSIADYKAAIKGAKGTVPMVIAIKLDDVLVSRYVIVEVPD